MARVARATSWRERGATRATGARPPRRTALADPTAAESGRPGAVWLSFSSSYADGIICVAIAACLFSTGGILLRQIEDATEWQVLFYRSISLAAMMLTVLAVRNGGGIVLAIRRSGWHALAGGGCLVLTLGGYVVAITHTTVASAMLLLATSPIMAAMLGRLILREPVRPRVWAAMCLALAGVAIMVAQDVNAGTLAGSAAALAVAFGGACFAVVLRHGSSQDMLPAVCCGGTFTAIGAAAAAASLGQNLQISYHDAAYALVLGIVQAGGAFLFLIAGARRVPAAPMVLLLQLEIVLAPLWVWLGVGETPGSWTLIGGAVVLLAVLGQLGPLGGAMRGREHDSSGFGRFWHRSQGPDQERPAEAAPISREDRERHSPSAPIVEKARS